MATPTSPAERPGLGISPLFSHGQHPFHDGSVQFVKRNAYIPGKGDGPASFEQPDVSFPDFWSQNAVNIVSQKYFRGRLGEKDREYSVKQLIGRVVEKIGAEGLKHGYFADEEEQRLFECELAYLLVHQMGAFNSPVWFNIGVKNERQVASACFILAVEDHLEDILDWYKREGLIFQNGSGAGLNISKIRGSAEPLARGGYASGPVTFMRGADSSAGTIKSGGKCLAPWQRVYTDQGPVPVKALAERGEDFVVLSYDPPAGRYKAKTARAFKEEQRKEVFRVHTDKGQFDLTADHPVKLSSGEMVKAGDLRPGHSLLSCSIQEREDGYLRVSLRDGQGGRELLHRLIARDVLGADIASRSVHHRDENPRNNHPSNLEVLSQADHVAVQGRDLASPGQHIFQRQSFANVGVANGMHSDGSFWQDEQRSGAYRELQGAILETSGRATDMQDLAARQRMLNAAFRVINAGYDITSFEGYVEGRKAVIGRIPSVRELEDKITHRFGSYDAFVQEVSAHNHRVQRIESLGVFEVFDVEVDCPTADDKSPQSGHNFVIWCDDHRGGTGIVVSNTRRAAKMVVMDVDHPDIREFIWCKAKEETKAQALADAGFDMSIDTPEGAENWASLQYQNANNSVRVTDEFMQAVLEDGTWDLLSRGHDEIGREQYVTDTVSAKELFYELADAAWRCADPGIQFDTTINRWHTTPNHSRISASNPCSEYMHIDNSSCNLASLNLKKFRNEDGTFNVESFRHAVRVLFTAQEILIAFAHYPGDKVDLKTGEVLEHDIIGRNTRDMRQIGIGFANLGALLMADGLPYDSDEARDKAAAITALMTGESYLQSCKLAARVGPFAHYEANKDAMLNVLRMHGKEANKLVRLERDPGLTQAAKVVWREVNKLAPETGVRNAQASVLAPTGTIAFMMDCDTTGIEPDFSLLKIKKLVGGGTMTIVNETVPEALSVLGYEPAQIKEISDHIMEHGTIVGAPHVDEEHYPVFACAVGDNTIHYMGHVKMMAACQPFLSGAISKTVNLPAEVTVEDIMNVYMESWRMGLKAVAVYRDGSKTVQPLSEKKAEGDGDELDAALAGLPRGRKRHLDDDPDSITHRFKVGGVAGWITVQLFEDGTPGGIIVNVGQAGSAIQGMINTWAITFSRGLRYGVPLADLVSKLTLASFAPQGFSSNPQIGPVKSIPDYIVKWMALRFLDDDAHFQLRIGPYLNGATHHAGAQEDFHPAVEVSSPVHAASPAPAHSQPAEEQKVSVSSAGTGICSFCGNMTQQAGTCQICTSCGESTGCG